MCTSHHRLALLVLFCINPFLCLAHYRSLKLSILGVASNNTKLVFTVDYIFPRERPDAVKVPAVESKSKFFYASFHVSDIFPSFAHAYHDKLKIRLNILNDSGNTLAAIHLDDIAIGPDGFFIFKGVNHLVTFQIDGALSCSGYWNDNCLCTLSDDAREGPSGNKITFQKAEEGGDLGLLCDAKKCNYRGKCQILDKDSRTYKCQCTPQFYGKNCKIDKCAECTKRGRVCSKDFKCLGCVVGFAGEHCNISVCDPRENVCKNNGTCTVSNNKHSCICDKASFTGRYCQFKCEPSCGDLTCHRKTHQRLKKNPFTGAVEEIYQEATCVDYHDETAKNPGTFLFAGCAVFLILNTVLYTVSGLLLAFKLSLDSLIVEVVEGMNMPEATTSRTTPNLPLNQGAPETQSQAEVLKVAPNRKIAPSKDSEDNSEENFMESGKKSIVLKRTN